MHVIAEMDESYVPASLVPQVVDWPWDELSDSASGQLGDPVDVRRTLIGLGESLGYADASMNPALAADNPPAVVHFEPLVPRAEADQAAPTQIIEGADDQPFPFYGRVRATWE